jgi:hypothetical protein
MYCYSARKTFRADNPIPPVLFDHDTLQMTAYHPRPLDANGLQQIARTALPKKRLPLFYLQLSNNWNCDYTSFLQMCQAANCKFHVNSASLPQNLPSGAARSGNCKGGLFGVLFPPSWGLVLA